MAEAKTDAYQNMVLLYIDVNRINLVRTNFVLTPLDTMFGMKRLKEILKVCVTLFTPVELSDLILALCS